MTNTNSTVPAWITRGKTIRELIKELNTFENQDLEVRISMDDGLTHKPISILGKSGIYCILENCESRYDSSSNG
jgi:hypothetical protein